MSAPERPRRSALYLPATNPRAVSKARSLPCDIVILDLEDSVLPEAKQMARQAAVEAVRAGGFGEREVIIRVNALSTPWGEEDFAAAAAAGPDGVLVPKIDSPADVFAANRKLAGGPSPVRLWAMVETSAAVLSIAAIAGAARGSRLAGLVMGINDLAKETGARQTGDRAPFWTAMSLTVMAARHQRLVALDGVHNDIEDLASLEAACQQAADFGFDGKTLIHPSHIPLCNRAFTPPANEVAWARAVIAAFDDPANAGKGALRVDGRLAERLHLGMARRILAWAASAADAISEARS